MTQRGIRVKQGIQDDYSSSRQNQKSPFLYYFGRRQALPPPVVFPRVTGRTGLAPAQPCCSPGPCSQHALPGAGEGRGKRAKRLTRCGAGRDAPLDCNTLRGAFARTRATERSV